MSFNMKESNNHKIFAVHQNENFKQFMKQAKPETSELIQGFSFNISSQKIKLSKDRDFLVASGVYKPVLKIFDVF